MLFPKEPQGKMLGTGPAAATAGAATSSNVSVLQQFASGLKSRNEETRAKAAKELQHYVTMELREVGLWSLGPVLLCRAHCSAVFERTLVSMSEECMGSFAATAHFCYIACVYGLRSAVYFV